MTQPLAVVLYERILPGTQLVNRLQDLKYRVLPVTDADTLAACVEREKPILVLADLVSTRDNVLSAIGQVKQNSATQHVPIIGFAPEDETGLQEKARAGGAALVVSDAAILSHLQQFLDQALLVE